MLRRKGKQRRSTTRVQVIDLPAGGFETPRTGAYDQTAPRTGPGASSALLEREDSGVMRVVDPMEELARERQSQRVDRRVGLSVQDELDTGELGRGELSASFPPAPAASHIGSPPPPSAPPPSAPPPSAPPPSAPSLDMPDLDMPDLDVPDLDVPDLDMPDLEALPPDAPLPDPKTGPLGLDGVPEADGDASIFAPGTVLEDKFEVQYRVGRGAMGEVFLAKDVYLKRSVAVKALNARHRADEVVGRFRSEAESMARVDHPNVVKIYSFGKHEGKPYFVMEYLDGESLAEYIDRRLVMQEVVHLDEIIGLLSQVCRGLGAIHAQGIVHRDVKPANVMITTTYRVALADFGLVGMITDDESKEVAVYGTPVYIAPERFDSRPLPPELAHSCDIYALGIILYELLTGEAPFDHDDTMTLLGMHASAPVPRASKLRPDVPPAIDDVIRKAMAKDPEDRYLSADEFRRALVDARDTGLSLEDHDSEFTALVVQPDAKAAVSTVRAVNMAHPSATVLTVADGDMALVFIREMRPELILFDADAPGLNALELCALLQEEKLLLAAKVVVLSPRSDLVEERYLKEIGVTEVLTKPVSGPDLVKVIRD